MGYRLKSVEVFGNLSNTHRTVNLLHTNKSVRKANLAQVFLVIVLGFFSCHSKVLAQKLDILDMLPAILSGALNPAPSVPGTYITDRDNRTCFVSNTMLSILNQHNTARAQGRTCVGVNGGFYPAVPALRWNCDITDAAVGHSTYMANINSLTHVGPAGAVNAGQRINNAGYTWATWAENIASGYAQTTSVMNAWLTSSSGHCPNVMDASIEDMGAALVKKSDEYWTVNFARHP